MYQYLFFDLDGTLTQSEFGIMNSIIYALKKMGIEEEDKEAMRHLIGPPLITSFKDFYHMNDEESEQAIKYYRECYNGGELFNAPLYDGIKETLKTLQAAGKKLYVVTSKPTVYADRIVEHFEVRKYFEGVIGPGISNKKYDKAELVKKAMDTVQESFGATPASAFLMIGDRLYDIEGAKANGIASAGVLYGYGSREELETAGATYIVAHPGDIIGVAEGVPPAPAV